MTQAFPLLAVGSTQREDHSCVQATHYVNQAKQLRVSAEVFPENLSHMEINRELGLDNSYTRAVEAFMASLDAAFSSRL